MREESERDVIQLYFINTCAQQKKSLADKSLNVGLSGGEENSDKFNYLKYLTLIFFNFLVLLLTFFIIIYY